MVPLRDVKTDIPHVNDLLHEVELRLSNLDDAVNLRLPWSIGQKYMPVDNVIISIGDIRFIIIRTVRWRSGSVYIALQLSEADRGRLRLIGYLSDISTHTSVALGDRRIDEDDVRTALEDTFSDKEHLEYATKVLLSCSPNIRRGAKQLVLDIILS